jgi:hypothetical protein
MSVNFLETTCKEPARSELVFGLCDKNDGSKAYSDAGNMPTWTALVSNVNSVEVTFTAIDNCIIILKDGTKDKESTCDGMLTFTNSLYLVELKDHGTGGWLPKAKAQLENTIRLLYESHELTDFRFKKAFACNKRHPNFVVIHSEEQKSFFVNTKGFRLDIQAQILIK